MENKLVLLKENIEIMLNARNKNGQLQNINIKNLPKLSKEYDSYKNDFFIDDTVVKFLYGKTEANNYKLIDRLITELKKTYKTIIFIKFYDAKMSKYLEDLNTYDNIQVFDYKRLMFNILEHKYIPQFKYIPTYELININLNKNQLPVILQSDPMAQYFNMQNEDIYEITRHNYKTYRICRGKITNTKFINSEQITMDNSTITLTFSEVVENHPGCEEIGVKVKSGEGFKVEELKIAEQLINSKSENKIATYYNLNDLLDSSYTPDEEAGLLVIKNGLKYLNIDANELFNEVSVLEVDKKQPGKGGIIVNSDARFNLCFANFSQNPDYEAKKYKVIDFKDVTISRQLRDTLPTLFNNENNFPKAQNLNAEGNYYYNTKKCGIGWHGDAERRKVIGIRLGKTMPLAYKWFIKHTFVGNTLEVFLEHGDIYIMSEKTVGTDWNSSSKLTLRHAAGCEKYLNLDKYNKDKEDK